jgi:hypothetical protein
MSGFRQSDEAVYRDDVRGRGGRRENSDTVEQTVLTLILTDRLVNSSTQVLQNNKDEMLLKVYLHDLRS